MQSCCQILRTIYGKKSLCLVERLFLFFYSKLDADAEEIGTGVKPNTGELLELLDGLSQLPNVMIVFFFLVKNVPFLFIVAYGRRPPTICLEPFFLPVLC